MELEEQLGLQLKELKLVIKDVKGDGNCLFRALTDPINVDHIVARRAVCKHILENKEEYQHFIEGDVQAYIERMLKDGVFGGHVELVAFSKVYQATIVVHQPFQDPMVIKNGDQWIHVAYYSWEHYSAVRPIGQLHGPCNIKIPLKSVKAEYASQGPPNKIEQIVLNQFNISIERVRELLVKYRGDPNRVLDQLYEEECEEMASSYDPPPS